MCPLGLTAGPSLLSGQQGHILNLMGYHGIGLFSSIVRSYHEHMAIFLEVISGKSLGLKFKASPGLKIGRSLGDVTIDDPRLSAVHAQVKSSDKGRLFLVDRESSNGIKVNGKRVDKVLLSPGASFQIGSTVCIVLEEADEMESTPSEEPAKPVALNWREVLKSQLPALNIRNLPTELPIRPFPEALSFRVIEGYQKSQEFWLYYGPRFFGLACLDFEIIDPDCPHLAFKVYWKEPNSYVFETSHPDKVIINGLSSTSENLQNGDIIRVGSTLIEVRMKIEEGNSST
jgi:pSer/pThr/pTyr-binding forkhead associated (FHA) protein